MCGSLLWNFPPKHPNGLLSHLFQICQKSASQDLFTTTSLATCSLPSSTPHHFADLFFSIFVLPFLYYTSYFYFIGSLSLCFCLSWSLLCPSTHKPARRAAPGLDECLAGWMDTTKAAQWDGSEAHGLKLHCLSCLAFGLLLMFMASSWVHICSALQLSFSFQPVSRVTPFLVSGSSIPRQIKQEVKQWKGENACMY